MSKEKIKVFELDIDVDAVIKSQSELKNKLDFTRLALNDLKKSGDTTSKKYVEMEAQVKSLSREYNSAQTQLGKMLTLQGKEIKTIQQGEAALTIINKEWSKQTQLYGENSAAAIKLANKHKELKDRTNELRKGIGDTSKNIGNYTNDISDALGLTRAQATATKTLAFTQTAYNVVVGKSTGAMKIFRIALASTGVGLLILALGSLVSYFTSTQEGINKVNRVLVPLKEAFSALKGQVQELGAAFAKLFSGDLSGFLSDVKKIGNTIKNDIGEAVERGKDIQAIQEKLNRNEADYVKKQSQLKRIFEEQKKLSDDTTKSQSEREEAARKAIKSQEELKAITVDRLDQEARIVELKQMANDTSDAEKTELARKRASIDDAIADEAAKTTEGQNKLNAIVKDGLSKRTTLAKKAAGERLEAAKKATDEAIKESKTRLNLFIEENERKADTLQKGLELEEQVRDRKIEILKTELEAKKLTQTEYDLAILQAKNNFLDEQAALTKQYADAEIEAEKERLARSQELEDLEKERKITDLENKKEIQAENFEAQLEIEKERLEMQRQQELEDAEKTGADKALINQKYAQIEKDIESEKQKFKQDLASQTFGNLAAILGKETKAGKAAAIAQTTIDTYQAAQAAYKSLAGIPIVGPALGAIAAAAAVASGIKSVQKITSTQAPQIPRAAKGATLRGPSHSGGGMNLYDDTGKPVVNAEGDENIYVLNKRASGLINSLSYLNQSTGGIPLSRSTSFAAAGGMIKQPLSVGSGGAAPGIDYDLLAAKMAQANMSLPRPVVAVEDINTGQNDYAKVVNGANI